MKKLLKKSKKALTLLVFALASMLSLFVLPAKAAYEVNMPEGVTSISHDIFDLHMFAIWVCVGIGAVVYGVMIFTIIRHRKCRGVTASSFHENTWLEIIWTVIPFIILIVLAIPATKVLANMEDTKNADITIKITGYQWKWRYDYLDQGVSFFSNLSTPIQQIYDEAPKDEWYLLEVDKPLVVPIHKKIRFLVTSNDVIHAWWVPALGIKRDAMPGFIHESWTNIDKPGIYRGQCAELCGVNHGYMPIVVKAVTDDEFKQWVANEYAAESAQASAETIVQTTALPASTLSAAEPAQQATPAVSNESAETSATSSETTSSSTAVPSAIQTQPGTKTFDELMTEGKAQYGKYCAVCHKMDGTGMPPVFPALKGSSVAVGNSIVRHIDLVLTGVPGTAMQAFADQLTDDELAAIVTFERNAWGNNTGDVVQVSDVKAAREALKNVPVTVKNQNITTNNVSQDTAQNVNQEAK